MKSKRIIAISLVLIIAVALYGIQKFIPDIAFNIGKQAYEQKNYPKAYEAFKFAVNLNGRNRDYRYYFVETLLHLKPTLKIQRELFKISQVNMPDSADLIADQQISKWRNQISFNIGENYIEQAPFNEGILRWDVTKFPLKVFIKSNSTSPPAYYQMQIQKAFLQWQASTNNFIRFEFVNKEENADIVVAINSSTDMKKCTEENCKYTVAYTTPTIKGDLLKKMDINFYDSNNLGQPFSEREIYNTALHEIGHSLGIMGHSYNKDDLMYMENAKPNEFSGFRNELQLISQKDLNTLTLLYMLIPDISNTPINEFDTSRQFFAPIIMGSDEQINSRKVLEAQNYIKAAPDLPNGYIDLSAAYAEQKEYNSSIEALNKALELSSNDNERFVIYYNFAVTYMRIEDWDNSLKYAELAKQIKPDSEIDGLIASVNFNKGDKKFAKKAYIDALAKNPANEIDALNLAIIYLRELNLPQAGRVLNNFVKASPEAANDPKIKSYGLLMFFFR